MPKASENKLKTSDYTVKDIADYIRIIKLNTGKKSYNYFFRGQVQNYSKDYSKEQEYDITIEQIKEDLKPSIYRKNKEGELPLLKNEHNLYKEFIIRNPNDFKDDNSTFEKLARMQHYSLPTRLLDITSNALMALYFACEYEDKKDGYVSIFRIKEDKIKYYDSDTISVISNITKRHTKENINDSSAIDFTDYEESINNSNTEKEVFMRGKMDIFNSLPATQYLIHEIKEEKPYFKDCIRYEHLNHYYCVRPLLNNRRIIRQDGAFLIFGMGKTKYDCPKVEEGTAIIIISNVAKKSIREDLKKLGISKDKVYPEMDKVAEYLKEKYS